MIVHADGSFFLDKGERCPFACPSCGWPKPFEENAPPVMYCDHCHADHLKEEWEAAEFKRMTVQ